MVLANKLSLGLRGIALIKGFETLRLEAYLPTANDVPTIGWGHTRNVKLGDKCTVGQAEIWFTEDTKNTISSVQGLQCELTQSMFDAICSLVYNVGSSSIGSASTIGSALAKKDYYSAWAGFSLWRKQKGKDLLGLARRRSKEMELFLEDDFHV